MRGLLARLARPRPETARRGDRGERLARRHLRRKGYRILARNLRVAPGEADIVALAPDRRTIVVVEVKTRSVSPGLPTRGERAITREKKRRMIRVALVIARKRGWSDRPLRIDIVAIDESEGDKPVIRHHEAAVTLKDR